MPNEDDRSNLERTVCKPIFSNHQELGFLINKEFTVSTGCFHTIFLLKLSFIPIIRCLGIQDLDFIVARDESVHLKNSS